MIDIGEYLELAAANVLDYLGFSIGVLLGITVLVSLLEYARNHIRSL